MARALHSHGQLSAPIKRRSRVGLSACLVASALLHLMIGLPFIIDALAEPPDEPPVLIVELQGAVSDVQAEQKVQQDTRGRAAAGAARAIAGASDGRSAGARGSAAAG